MSAFHEILAPTWIVLRLKTNQSTFMLEGLVGSLVPSWVVLAASWVALGPSRGRLVRNSGVFWERRGSVLKPS